MNGEELTEPTTENSEMPVPPQKAFDQYNANWWEGGQRIRIGESFTPRRLDTPLDKLVRRYGGRRSRTQTSRKRGRYIQARPANGDLTDVAFDATLRAAAPYQVERAKENDGLALHVHSDDFMKKVRVRRAANLILFLVDASWSMAVAERMSATKGAIVSLLTDAYQRRDKVGLIVFQKDRATLILPPTNSIQLAQRALKNIPVGGKTPLSAGLAMAEIVVKKELMIHPDVRPILIVMTDGAGNVAQGAYAPLEEAYQIAEKLAHEDIHSVVINMEAESYDQGLAYTLAKKLDAPCLTIKELKAEHLYMAVRQVRDDIQRSNV